MTGCAVSRYEQFETYSIDVGKKMLAIFNQFGVELLLCVNVVYVFLVLNEKT